MPEQLEEILKQIHVLFSKSDMYQGSPDRIVLNKREMFELLEKLNYAVMGVMEQYEATEQSRKNAQLKLEAEKQSYIKRAHEEAADIYAAARMYADEALSDLSDIMQEAKRDIKTRFEQLDDEIIARLDGIQHTRGELKFDLEAMANSEKYLNIIEEYNEKKEREKLAAKRRREAAEAERAEEEDEKKPVRKVEASVYEPLDEEGAEINIPSKYNIVVNARPDNIFERTLEKGGKNKKKKNKNKKDNQGNEEEVEALRSEDLDAEYYRWQEEQEKAEEKSEKKLSIFSKFKEKK